MRTKETHPHTWKLSDEKYNCLAQHTACKSLFAGKMKNVKLEDSEELNDVQRAYFSCLMEMSFSELDFTLSEFEGAFKTHFRDIDTAIVLAAVKVIGSRPMKEFAKSIEDAAAIMSACFNIESQIKALSEPIRAEAIEEFYSTITVIHENEVDKVLANAKERMKGMMPGTTQPKIIV